MNEISYVFAKAITDTPNIRNGKYPSVTWFFYSQNLVCPFKIIENACEIFRALGTISLDMPRAWGSFFLFKQVSRLCCKVFFNFQFPCLTNDKSEGQRKKPMQLLHLTKTALWKAWLNYGQIADETSLVWVILLILRQAMAISIPVILRYPSYWMHGLLDILENEMIKISGVWKINIS